MFWTHHSFSPALVFNPSLRRWSNLKASWNIALKQLLLPMCQTRNSRSLAWLSVSMEVSRVPNDAPRPHVPKDKPGSPQIKILWLCGGGDWRWLLCATGQCGVLGDGKAWRTCPRSESPSDVFRVSGFPKSSAQDLPLPCRVSHAWAQQAVTRPHELGGVAEETAHLHCIRASSSEHRVIKKCRKKPDLPTGPQKWQMKSD